MATMGPWGYHQIVLSAQLLQLPSKNTKEAVTKGVKDNYIQRDVSPLCSLLLFVIFCTPGTMEAKANTASSKQTVKGILAGLGKTDVSFLMAKPDLLG